MLYIGILTHLSDAIVKFKSSNTIDQPPYLHKPEGKKVDCALTMQKLVKYSQWLHRDCRDDPVCRVSYLVISDVEP